MSSLRVHMRGSLALLLSLLLVFSMFVPAVGAVDFEDGEQQVKSEGQVQQELLMDGDENKSLTSNNEEKLEQAITEEVESDNEQSTFTVRFRINGKNGEILKDDSVEVAEKQTALEALKRVLEAQDIPYELETTTWGTYVKSINGESEGGFNGWDGWMYSVNGEEPEVGADDYELEDGDTIQFYYSSWAIISSDTEIQEGEINPTVTVSVVGDRFSSDVTNKENWAIQADAVGLDIGLITKKSDQQVTVSFNGQVQTGTLAIKALAEALEGNQASEEITIEIMKDESVLESKESLNKMIEDTVRYYKDRNTQISSWTTLVALWGAGEELTDGTWKLPVWRTAEPNLSPTNGGTEHIRYIFGLLAMGEDPSNAWATNRNLYDELAQQQNDSGAIGGINKHMWAMLALAAGEQAGHDVGAWDEEKKQKALQHLLKAQIKEDGGFALSGKLGDTDLTGMALLTLGNYQGDSAVDAAIKRAKGLLKERQLDTAGFNSVGPWGTGDNSNSLSTSVSGLIAIGEDLFAEEWTVGEKTVVDSYRRFQLEDGSFKFQLNDKNGNGMATEQALIALLDIQTGKSVWQRIAERETAEQEQPDEVTASIQSASELILQKGVTSEWEAIGLARAGVTIPVSYEEKFFDNLNSQVVNKVGSGSLKVTDVERLAIAAAAIGKDVTNINEEGLNLIEKIYNSEHWTWENTDSIIYQGNNGILFALIALDSKGFDVPADAKWTRDKLVAELLKNQHASGAWGLTASSTGSASLDITAMVLISLAPYTQDPVVKDAVDKAVAFLSEKQGPSGGFNDPWNGGVSSETTAQVIIGLAANKIDPRGAEFTKEGINLIDHLLSFQSVDGGFKHIVTDTRSNGMATEQALQALVAFDLFIKDEGRLYDFGKEVQPETGVVQVKPGEPFVFDDQLQPDIYKSLVLDFGQFEAKKLPKITAERGGTKLEIPEGTDVTNDWDKKLQVPTVLAPSDDVKEDIDAKLEGEKVSNIVVHIKVGGEQRINFSQYVMLTLKDQGAYEAGFIDTEGNFELIKKYPTAAAAENATEDVYAYKIGEDLLIKTKHFTEFLTFETETVEPGNPGSGDESGGGSNGGGPSTPSTKTVTLSVEKRTMDGSDIIESTDVTLQSGDTAFTLLKRVVDGKRISIDYIGSGASLYVQAIDGLGEFDGGPDSGWMYSVNGVYPNYSAGLYTLRDGDILRWRYTKDLGHDIGGGYVPEGGSPGTSGPGGGGGATPPAKEVSITSEKPFELDEDLQKDVSIPVIVNFGGKNKELPAVSVLRGNTLLEIVQGTKVTSEWDGKLQLPTSLNFSGLNLEKINTVLELSGKELSKVDFRLKVGGDKTIQFDRHVTLTLKDKGNFEVGFLDENGNFELIQKYLSTDATDDVYAYTDGNDLIIKTNHFTEFVTFTSKFIDKSIEFTDVTDTWAKEFIEKAVQTGLFKGYEDGTFQPNKTLTRAQAASLIVRGLELTTDQSSPFKDIGSYAKETQAEIAAAYQYGIIIGQQENFNPSGEVTRAQMALMLHRAYEQKTGEKYVAAQKAPYLDFGNYDEETVNAISMLYELEIATGSDGRYNPNQSTTRAHAAKMFVNFFESLER